MVSARSLGGVLVAADLAGSGWRAIFLVNVPVGLVALLLGLRTVPDSRSEHPARGRPARAPLLLARDAAGRCCSRYRGPGGGLAAVVGRSCWPPRRCSGAAFCRRRAARASGPAATRCCRRRCCASRGVRSGLLAGGCRSSWASAA